eukprot:1159660-Pelagomonas_calceolata.AAC.16
MHTSTHAHTPLLIARCLALPRARGEALVALKEIPLSDMSIFGATDAERSAGLGRMCKEVEILSSLDHPNIVQVGLQTAAGKRLRSCLAWTTPTLCRWGCKLQLANGEHHTHVHTFLTAQILRVFRGWTILVHRHGACGGVRYTYFPRPKPSLKTTSWKNRKRTDITVTVTSNFLAKCGHTYPPTP